MNNLLEEIHINRNKNRYKNILVLFYILIIYIYKFKEEPTFLSIDYRNIIQIIGFILLLREIRLYRNNKSILIFTSFFLLFYLLNNFIWGEIYLNRYYSILAQTGLGIAIANSKLDKVAKYLLIFLLLLLINYVVILDNHPRFLVNSNLSENMISVLSISLLILYYIGITNKGEIRKRRNEILIITSINVIICFFAIGRGGIITSIFLLAGTIYYYFKDSLNTKKFILVSLVAPVIIAISYSNFYSIFAQTKFDEQGLESFGRLIAAGDYLKRIFSNSIYLLFGVPGSQIKHYITLGHLHNSFLQAHAFMGIGVFLIIGLILYTANKLFNTNQGLLFISLIALSIRAYTDDILPNISWFTYSLLIALFIISKRKALN